MSFLADLGITEQSDLAKLGFVQQYEKLEEAKLKYSPQLQHQRNVLYISVTLILGIAIVILIQKLL